MKKILLLILLPLLILPAFGHAQHSHDSVEVLPEDGIAPPPPVPQAEEFYRGEVLEILDEYQEDFGLGGTRPFIQTVKVKFLEGPQAGEEATIDYGVLIADQKLTAGQKVILLTPNDTPHIFDRYRLPALGGILILFIVMAVIFAGWRGLTSLAGLAVSIAILAMYVVPQIMAGKNPLLVSLVGAFVIALVSLYLAHGFNRRTTAAVISTLITIVIAIGLSQLFTTWGDLTGTGSEESYHLQTSPIGFVNLKGLLLGGIIIGALGVLDDITTSQTAAVYQIWRANPKLSPKELFQRGTAVGKEHITSLINTLALAYVGASLPALLLFTVYQRPLWVVTNTETIAEEIIRTLVGSTALMVAVPITTFIAAYWLPKTMGNPEDTPPAPAHTH